MSLHIRPVPHPSSLVPLAVHLLPTPARADLAVLIDVLRFTSSATYALAHGARSVMPCATLEQAHALAATHRLAGERNARRPDGFDFGNSPLEFTREAVQGRDLAWTTTNGTRAISRITAHHINTDSAPTRNAPVPVPAPVPRPFASPSSPFRDVVLASYVNLSAVASLLEPLLREDVGVAIVCAGRDGGFSLEDAACAGALVRRLQGRLGDRLTTDDGARAGACIDEAYGEDIARLFRDAQHGRYLRDHGFGPDLDACAALDAVQVVPRCRDGRFVVG